MKIIVGGAGSVGQSIIGYLSRSDNDIVVIDPDQERLSEVARLYDVQPVKGSVSNPDIQEKAGADKADILISAIGKANFVTADYVKPGAVVIDVGMNRNEEGKLCGDVDFESVSPIASAITPVPGGVGPMTVTMLLVNCVRSVEINS